MIKIENPGEKSYFVTNGKYTLGVGRYWWEASYSQNWVSYPSRQQAVRACLDAGIHLDVTDEIPKCVFCLSDVSEYATRCPNCRNKIRVEREFRYRVVTDE